MRWSPRAVSVYQRPQPTMWAVLSLLLAVDMYILAREDIARHKADKVTNAQKVQRPFAPPQSQDQQPSTTAPTHTFARTALRVPTATRRCRSYARRRARPATTASPLGPKSKKEMCVLPPRTCHFRVC